jgi:phosphoribosyl 1,2-cyclic phosphodiesterase
MHIEFLGTAAAEGFPDPFCACAACENARREGGRSIRLRSSALINDELLIDLGPDLYTAALRRGRSLGHVTYVLQTHPHSDHLDQNTLFARAAGCQVEGTAVARVFCSRATIAQMDRRLLATQPHRSFALPEVQQAYNLAITPIAPWQEATFGRYRVQTVKANHDVPELEAMLFAIEDTASGATLFYGTDTGPLPADTWTRLADLGWTFDVFILDHTFGFAGRSTGHLNQEQFLEEVDAARAAGVLTPASRVYATHVAHHSHAAHDELAARAELAGYDVAYDGLVVEVAVAEKVHDGQPVWCARRHHPARPTPIGPAIAAPALGPRGAPHERLGRAALHPARVRHAPALRVLAAALRRLDQPLALGRAPTGVHRTRQLRASLRRRLRDAELQG